MADEALGPVDVYGADRLFVSIGDVEHPIGLDVLADDGHPVIELDLDDPLDLGAQVLVVGGGHRGRAAALLGINPFDQPNVAEAKEATNAVLASGAPRPAQRHPRRGPARGRTPATTSPSRPTSTPTTPVVAELEEIRLELRDEHQVATTFGIGPRFLHSTGQLHKGGPPTGVLPAGGRRRRHRCRIPGQEFTFSQLKHAQADGDLLTLATHGLRACRTTAGRARPATSTRENRNEDRDDRPREDGRQHGRAAPPSRPRGRRAWTRPSPRPTAHSVAELVAAARRRRPAQGRVVDGPRRSDHRLGDRPNWASCWRRATS